MLSCAGTAKKRFESLRSSKRATDRIEGTCIAFTHRQLPLLLTLIAAELTSFEVDAFADADAGLAAALRAKPRRSAGAAFTDTARRAAARIAREGMADERSDGWGDRAESQTQHLNMANTKANVQAELSESSLIAYLY